MAREDIDTGREAALRQERQALLDDLVVGHLGGALIECCLRLRVCAPALIAHHDVRVAPACGCVRIAMLGLAPRLARSFAAGRRRIGNGSGLLARIKGFLGQRLEVGHLSLQVVPVPFRPAREHRRKSEHARMDSHKREGRSSRLAGKPDGSKCRRTRTNSLVVRLQLLVRREDHPRSCVGRQPVPDVRHGPRLHKGVVVAKVVAGSCRRACFSARALDQVQVLRSSNIFRGSSGEDDAPA